MNTKIALNFMRSAMEPMINAGVMMAKVNWKQANTSNETHGVETPPGAPVTSLKNA